MLRAFPSSRLHYVRVTDIDASLRFDLAGRVRTSVSNAPWMFFASHRPATLVFTVVYVFSTRAVCRELIFQVSGCS